MVAGRDLVSGGTWFGVGNGRWAAVTNVREGSRDKSSEPSTRSRGWLVRDYLQSGVAPQVFLHELGTSAADYAGFNLLLGDGQDLWYGSNRGPAATKLAPGIYGLSNHLLDTPWPKVARGKQALQSLVEAPSGIDIKKAFAILSDMTRAPDDQLPQTGIPLPWEQGLSAIFVTMPSYGTRSAAVLMRSAQGATQLIERRFDRTPQPLAEDTFRWDSSGSLLDK